MKALSGELDYRIRYDVEHDLFHAQNVFNDEYITPTFVEYVQNLEKENTELKNKLEHRNCVDCSNHGSNIKLLKAKVFIRSLKSLIEDVCDINYLSKDNTRLLVEAEQFLNEVEK